ncbi:MAG: crossover junction endodeoxyribonuclease RuvC [Acidobacteria bacterium]|nr:crossover junction endodeoxyribonuclease RuvC [Acidobacteriota bacterium]
MRILGVDPGSRRTGYGCIETSGSRHRLIVCGAISAPAQAPLPDKLLAVHDGLAKLLAAHKPDVVALQDPFYARNARSALVLGHVRGALMLAAAKAGLPAAEYSPAEVKQAVVGYGRADKRQVQQMVTLLLGMDAPPSPLDASDALAVAVCHAHSIGRSGERASRGGGPARSWRQYRPRETDEAAGVPGRRGRRGTQ